MKQKRVIVADDDSDQRELLRMLLQREGFDVIAVSNGVELLEVLENAQDTQGLATISLVITDLMMPFCTGLEVLETIQAKGLRVPVVVVSAVADMLTRAHAERLGARAFVTKPFDRADLRQRIEAALAS